MSKSYTAIFRCDNERLAVTFSTDDAKTVEQLREAADDALLARYPDQEQLARAVIMTADVQIRQNK